MSGQIDVGWSAPPFGLEDLDRESVELEPFTGGRHTPDLRQHEPTDGLELTFLHLEPEPRHDRET